MFGKLHTQQSASWLLNEAGTWKPEFCDSHKLSRDKKTLCSWTSQRPIPVNQSREGRRWPTLIPGSGSCCACSMAKASDLQTWRMCALMSLHVWMSPVCVCANTDTQWCLVVLTLGLLRVLNTNHDLEWESIFSNTTIYDNWLLAQMSVYITHFIYMLHSVVS